MRASPISPISVFHDEGRIIDFGLDIEPCLRKGKAFMTSGCPDSDGRLACNRPFGNERASEPMRNYPFQPGPEEIRRILLPNLGIGDMARCRTYGNTMPEEYMETSRRHRGHDAEAGTVGDMMRKPRSGSHRVPGIPRNVSMEQRSAEMSA